MGLMAKWEVLLLDEARSAPLIRRQHIFDYLIGHRGPRRPRAR